MVVLGIAGISWAVAVPAWQQHRRDAETRAFLDRVATPSAYPSPTSGPATATALPDPSLPSDQGALATPTAPAGPATFDQSAPAPLTPPLAPDAPIAGGASTPAHAPRMPLPTHLTIPAIGVDADIVEVGTSPTVIDGTPALIWDVPAYAVGHQFSSASPGEGENVVLNGHDDWQGEMFKNLYKLRPGDEIAVRAGDRDVRYRVAELLLLPEAGQPVAKRRENAAFIGTTGDERLTLVTCWPYGVDDHRLVVIARPTAG